MLLKELEEMWENNLNEFLTKKHGTEIKLLLKTYENFKKRNLGVDQLIFESKAVLHRTWEMLNVGKWSEVPEEKKQVYAIASFIQVIGMLHGNEKNAKEKCLEVTDLGILLGCPFRSISLTKVADILSKNLTEAKGVPGSSGQEDINSSKFFSSSDYSKRMKLMNEIDCLRCPSLESFYNNFFTKNRPVKLTGCMDHWPALNLWKDFGYIVKKAGHRIVPIEVGKHYVDEKYSQKLMKISDFVSEFFKRDSETVGYLAQHQLFDQVPELKNDIHEPDYCALSQHPDDSGKTEINAWFGPKGTVSPLHQDPKHNLLCQVVGAKKIILYPNSDSQYLYPYESSLLFNTSRVDAENPDLSTYPDFAKATPQECLLNPGEMLYIPPKYWHHVRSLESSFSVSFWWE